MATSGADFRSNFHKRFAALQEKLAKVGETAPPSEAPELGGRDQAKVEAVSLANVDDIREKLLAKAVASGRLPPSAAEAGARRASLLPPVSGGHGEEVRAAAEAAGLPGDAATQLAQLATARRAEREQRAAELQKLAKQAEQLQTALARGIPKPEPPGEPDPVASQAERLRQVWEAQQKVEADLQELLRGSAEQMGKGKGKAFGKWPGKAAFPSEHVGSPSHPAQGSPVRQVARPSIARPGATRPSMGGRQLAPSSFRSPAELQALAAAQGRPPAGQDMAQRHAPTSAAEEPRVDASRANAWHAAAEETPVEAPADAESERRAEPAVEAATSSATAASAHVPGTSTVAAAPSAATHATSAAGLYPIESEMTTLTADAGAEATEADDPAPSGAGGGAVHAHRAASMRAKADAGQEPQASTSAAHADDPTTVDDGSKTAKQTRFSGAAEQREVPSEQTVSQDVSKKSSRARKSWFGK